MEDAIEALSRSGYLLENRIAQRLDGFATHLMMNVLFTDPETGRPRELDAYCFRGHFSDNHEFLTCSAHLLIECVNNPQPIAFFRTSRKLNLYPILAARPAWLGPQPMEETIGIDECCYGSKLSIATNYCTFATKKAGEWMVTHADEQHTEFNTLAALAQLTREKQMKVLDELSRPQDAIEFCGLELIYPILVAEGILLEVSQDSKGTVELREVDHVRYSKSQIWKGTRRYCPIDVVTESFFPEILKLIESDCRSVLHRLDERSDEIWEAVRNQETHGERAPDEDFLP
jgi:hypothetical protein